MSILTHGNSSSDPTFKPCCRREFLYTGLIGGLGLSLGSFLKMRDAQARDGEALLKEGAAKSVIHIYMPGGMAHQETFDPHPNAPIEYRGPLGTVPTKISGEVFSANLPKTAGIADKITVIRSMTHGEADHDRGTHNMFTGYRPSPAIQFPSFGSVVSHEFGSRKNLPPYVAIPGQANNFAGPGYLSSAYGPFALGADPASGNFQVRDLTLPGGMNAERWAKRQSLLSTVDYHFKQTEKSDSLDAMDSFYNRAYAMISSKEAREAFDLTKETDEIKTAYGKNAAGMRMLLSRRLVESGVRFVSMTYGGWDHHDNIKTNIENQLPPFDQAFAALINDLDSRGLLASTLVMVSSEFGRTPKINATNGRDHWPKVFSVVLAGGGIKRGLIYGASDATGAEPERDAVSIEDLASTIYNRLGIDGDKRLMSPGNRPIDIVRGGHVIKELLA
ncbi:MAG TPA: DUF1501 domain-containing protein [Planctomycetota bacterium]|nr:DUF1501 domain-containing protein [Planctomycetota bacterium]